MRHRHVAGGEERLSAVGLLLPEGRAAELALQRALNEQSRSQQSVAEEHELMELVACESLLLLFQLAQLHLGAEYNRDTDKGRNLSRGI